jgi:formiminoglutamase
MEDSNWPRADAWLKSGAHGGLAVLGAPVNASITPGRCDLGPTEIRASLAKYSPYDLEHALDLRALPTFDFGNAEVLGKTPEEAFEPIRVASIGALRQARALVLLGGDNAITRPGVHALGALHRVGLVTLDAHLDLRDTGPGLTNGNPVRALLSDGLPGVNIAQIGIQSFANSAAYADVARAAGIKIVTAEQAHAGNPAAILSDVLDGLANRVDAIYFDLDVDVLDRSFSPGTPGARPGGLLPWQVRQCAYVAGRHPKVRIMDLVEVDPDRDVNSATCLAAAAFLLCFASGVLSRGPN